MVHQGAPGVKDKDMDGANEPLDAVARAALRLAARSGWPVAMPALAAEAGLSMADLRAVAPGRGCIVAAVVRCIDRETLARIGPADVALSSRERLFDVLMQRFEVMEAHRPGLAAIMDSLARDPVAAAAIAPAVKRSIAWMLHAAAIDVRGTSLRGVLTRAGVLAVYTKALWAWRTDTGPDLPRTMATLDAALARAERAACLVRWG